MSNWVRMMPRSESHFKQNTVPCHASQVCPPGVEASVFALLAGFSNFGMTYACPFAMFCLSVFPHPNPVSRCTAT